MPGEDKHEGRRNIKTRTRGKARTEERWQVIGRRV